MPPDTASLAAVATHAFGTLWARPALVLVPWRLLPTLHARFIRIEATAIESTPRLRVKIGLPAARRAAHASHKSDGALSIAHSVRGAAGCRGLGTYAQARGNARRAADSADFEQRQVQRPRAQ